MANEKSARRFSVRGFPARSSLAPPGVMDVRAQMLVFSKFRGPARSVTQDVRTNDVRGKPGLKSFSLGLTFRGLANTHIIGGQGLVCGCSGSGFLMSRLIIQGV